MLKLLRSLLEVTEGQWGHRRPTILGQAYTELVQELREGTGRQVSSESWGTVWTEAHECKRRTRRQKLWSDPASVLLQAAPLPALDITGMSQRENSLQANVKAGPAPYQGPTNGRW